METPRLYWLSTEELKHLELWQQYLHFEIVTWYKIRVSISFSVTRYPIMGPSLSECTYPLPSCSELQSKVLHSAPAPSYHCPGRRESVGRKTGSWGWMPSDKWNLVEADLRHWLGWRLRPEQMSNYQRVKMGVNKLNFANFIELDFSHPYEKYVISRDMICEVFS